VDLEQIRENPTLNWMIEHLRRYDFGLQDFEVKIKSNTEERDDGRARFYAGPDQITWVLTIIAMPKEPTEKAPVGSLASFLRSILNDGGEHIIDIQSQLREKEPKPIYIKLDPGRRAILQHLTLTRKASKLPTFTLEIQPLDRVESALLKLQREPKWV
jgi:hypothetical protein